MKWSKYCSPIAADCAEGSWSSHGKAAKTSGVQCRVFGWLAGWCGWPNMVPALQFHQGAECNSEDSTSTSWNSPHRLYWRGTGVLSVRISMLGWGPHQSIIRSLILILDGQTSEAITAPLAGVGWPQLPEPGDSSFKPHTLHTKFPGCSSWVAPWVSLRWSKWQVRKWVVIVKYKTDFLQKSSAWGGRPSKCCSRAPVEWMCSSRLAKWTK